MKTQTDRLTTCNQPLRDVSGSDSLRVPVTIWVEIGDERIERECSVTIPLPQGHCPKLAKSLMLKPIAQQLHGMMVKTGVSF
jgi:hypothetical protein